MPYRHIEETQRRASEKVMPFATYANILGIGLGGFPGLLFSSFAEGALQGIFLVGALLGAMVGMVLTSEIHGHLAHERVRVWVRARLTRFLQRPCITPQTLTGTARPSVAVTAIPVTSRVRPVRRGMRRPPSARSSDAYFSAAQLPD